MQIPQILSRKVLHNRLRRHIFVGSDFFQILEPGANALRHARRLWDADGDGVKARSGSGLELRMASPEFCPLWGRRMASISHSLDLRFQSRSYKMKGWCDYVQ
jgi:hypothetical protein